MAGFNGSGTFVRTYSWVTDKGNSVKVTASRVDTEDDGFATGLSTCILKDGQQTTTAVIPFAQGTRNSDGSAATPSISFISDTDTGLFRIGANNVGLAIAGAQAWDFGTATSSVAGSLVVGGTLLVGGVAVTGSLPASANFSATCSAAALIATGIVSGASASFTATCAAVTIAATTITATGLVSGASASFTATCAAVTLAASGAVTGASANFSATCSAAAVHTTGNIVAGGTITASGGALGTAAFLAVGTSASQVVQLDGSAKLPAVDGSALTNLSAVPIPSSATLAVGAVALLYTGGSTNVNDGATTAGSNLTIAIFDNSNVVLTSGAGGTQTGTWKNISGINLSNVHHAGLFVRTA